MKVIGVFLLVLVCVSAGPLKTVESDVTALAVALKGTALQLNYPQILSCFALCNYING